MLPRPEELANEPSESAIAASVISTISADALVLEAGLAPKIGGGEPPCGEGSRDEIEREEGEAAEGDADARIASDHRQADNDADEDRQIEAAMMPDVLVMQVSQGRASGHGWSKLRRNRPADKLAAVGSAA